jgi:hypothetical protein
MARKLPKLRRVTQRPRKKLRDAPAKKSNADNQQLRKSEKMHKTKSIKLLLMLLLLIPLLQCRGRRLIHLSLGQRAHVRDLANKLLLKMSLLTLKAAYR